MTAKQKASELYLIFGRAISKPLKRGGYKFNVEQAKQCALIAVDEIIKALHNADTAYDLVDKIEYWNEVKDEIEKL